VFPEADHRLGDEWVHLTAGDSGFPTYDLEFVEALLAEITTRAYPTGSATVTEISADPGLVYAAGFSNGGGMVWQLMNSDLVTRFQGFAAVGKALDPEKADTYRKQVTDAGSQPVPVPVVYIHGTGDRGYRPPSTLGRGRARHHAAGVHRAGDARPQRNPRQRARRHHARPRQHQPHRGRDVAIDGPDSTGWPEGFRSAPALTT
jgi:hypothetical protein